MSINKNVNSKRSKKKMDEHAGGISPSKDRLVLRNLKTGMWKNLNKDNPIH